MDTILGKLFASFRMPVVKAEEDELVDPLDVLKEECAQTHCSKLLEKYETCNTRVRSKKQTAETCAEELFDFMDCVNPCVAKTIFTKLK